MSRLLDKDKVLAWLQVQPAGATWTPHEVASLLARGDFEPTVTLGDGSEARIGHMVNSIGDDDSSYPEFVPMRKEILGFDGDVVFAKDADNGAYTLLDRGSIVMHREQGEPDTWERLKADMEEGECDKASAIGLTCRFSCHKCRAEVARAFIARAKALGGVA
jgi:hypothetical protein